MTVADANGLNQKKILKCQHSFQRDIDLRLVRTTTHLLGFNFIERKTSANMVTVVVPAEFDF
jgi:ssRNA-specific RNase YbeY (16S rRNA maturation enzyme)